MFNRGKGWGQLAALCLMFALLFGSGGLTMPGAASAAEISLTVFGDGVTNPMTFTRADLEDMDQVEPRIYSSINTWPSKRWHVAGGVRLADVLQAAGITEDAKLLLFKSTDGFSMTFTKKELLDDPRFNYPGLMDVGGEDGGGHIPGSPEGAEPVETILALQTAEGDDFAYLNDREAPRLIFGQRWVTEQNNHAFAKFVGTIEVSTANPEKWPDPTAAPASGMVETGTGVVLESQYNDADKVYYTTDGSDPTYESPMYNWIASRWWGPRADDLAIINHPIEITEDTTIKAKTIGLGKEDSDIITFEYQVPVLNPAPELAVDTINNIVGQAVDITFSDDATWRETLSGIKVNDVPLSESQYTVTAGNVSIVPEVFADAGDYTIMVSATGYSDAIVTQTMLEGTPPPVLQSSDVTTQGDVSLTFDKAMADPTGIGAESQFEVLVDGQKVAVSAVVKTNAAGKIKLELATKILGGQAVTVAYTRSSDGNKQIKSTEGGILKSFSATTVTNGLEVLSPPALISDNTDNEVGQPIDIAFTTDAAWEAAITGITVNGSTLTSGQYAVAAGNINIAGEAFTASGEYAVVVKATGYSDAKVTQTMVAVPLVFVVEVNGVEDTPYTMVELKAMPNTTKTFGTYICTGVDFKYLLESLGVIDDPSWTMKLKTVDFPNGVNLALSFALDPVNNCLLTYERDGEPINELSPLRLYYGDGTSSKQNYKYVTGIMITKPADPPALVADFTGNKLGQAVDISFTTDAVWEAAITAITVNGNALTSGQYAVAAGYINIAAEVFADTGDYEVVVKATGYSDATVTQKIIGINEMVIGNIYTIAGNSTKGYSGDNGLAINASLYNPWDVALDGTGGFYIADIRNHCIRKVNSDGIISTVAGTGTTAGYAGDGDLATGAQLNSPSGLAVDSLGNLFIADTCNNCIRKVSTEGIITTIAGNGTAGYTGDNGAATSAQLNAPRSIALDSADNLYIADSGNRAIRKVDSSGDITTIYCTSSNQIDLYSVAVDKANNIYFGIFNLNTYNGEIQRLSPDSTIIKVSVAKRANGLAADSAGNLYFVDNSNIKKLDANGEITQIAGGGRQGVVGDGGPATSAYIDASGIATDNEGNLYFADGSYSWSVPSYNQRVRFVKLGDAPIPAAPELTADITSNNVGLPVDLNFANDANWQAAINVVKVNGKTVDSSKYTVTESNINIATDVFAIAGDYTVAVYATGYQVSVVIQTINKTWYVDHAGNGDFTTIQAAVTAANAGDTIIVKDGTYTENVLVDKSLTIQSEKGAALTTVIAAVSTAPVFDVDANSVVIDGFSVKGPTRTHVAGIELVGVNDCTIQNNDCSGGCYNGIHLGGTASNNTITGNYCHDNYMRGISIRDTANGNFILKNTAENNGEAGFCIKDQSANNVLWLNNIIGNSVEILTVNSYNSPTPLTYTYNNITYTDYLGNYWENYVGSDKNGNGIGDTPYNFGAYSDNYPLMGQWNDGVITGSAPVSYTVTFAVTPEDATLVVKDTESVEVAAETDGTYNLGAGTYSYTISAEGYITKTGTFTVVDGAQTVTVTLEEETVQPNTPQYNVIPIEDAIYTIGKTKDGIKTMTVNAGQSGFKYFEVSIEPVKANDGTETVVFAHLRNGAQLQLNASVADFDVVNTAEAGFNVISGDIVKVYIVDQLTNDTDHNPIVLQ